ncbi:MAG: hypothetical protein GXP46_00295 [Deferribacteres bacterium]|nr:hypothetical protein [Deferribacteres bacterium]
MTETAKDRLRRANEYIQEAELIRREKIGNLHVLANLYHAMMNCLFALLDVRDIGKLTHADVIEEFEKQYMQSGVFSTEFSDALHFTYNITHECDCDHMKHPEDEDIDRLFPVAGRFARAVEEYLKKNQ